MSVLASSRTKGFRGGFRRVFLVLGPLVAILQSSAIGAGGFLYTANEGGSISKIDAGSNALIRNIQLDGVVHNVQVSPNGDLLGAVLIPRTIPPRAKMGKMKGSALFFDTKDDRLAKSVTVGDHPAHIVFTPDGKYVLVTNSEDDTVSVIDARTYAIVQTIPTGKTPHGLRISKDSRYAYIANMGEDTVSVLDLGGLKEERRLKVGKIPVTTGITGDGRTLVVTLNAEDSLAIVDLSSGGVFKVEVGHGPAQVFIGPDNRFAFVANQGTEKQPSNTVSQVDLKSRKVVATITVGKGAHGVVTDDRGRFVYVTDMFDDTVSVIDISRNRVIATVPVGQTPNGITYKD